MFRCFYIVPLILYCSVDTATLNCSTSSALSFPCSISCRFFPLTMSVNMLFLLEEEEEDPWGAVWLTLLLTMLLVVSLLFRLAPLQSVRSREVLAVGLVLVRRTAFVTALVPRDTPTPLELVPRDKPLECVPCGETFWNVSALSWSRYELGYCFSY